MNLKNISEMNKDITTEVISNVFHFIKVIYKIIIRKQFELYSEHSDNSMNDFVFRLLVMNMANTLTFNNLLKFCQISLLEHSRHNMMETKTLKEKDPCEDYKDQLLAMSGCCISVDKLLDNKEVQSCNKSCHT